jgi:hypothetical protein
LGHEELLVSELFLFSIPTQLPNHYKYGWIAIVVRHWDEKKRLQKMKKSEKKMRRITDYGLKFAIHTYAVRLIINDPSIVNIL